ncbi:uncharacterized protein L201_003432 [Kwoniella dendrophila CBS 6074]|uniref:Uncharacterized protein n=1 Tax=Kwoniella dendrophila CBS 6074 TaxID=1295534 RepID=A0AAX4JTJ8_9TREE
MSAQILSSPFLNLNTINTILSSPAPIPIEQKIQLLEAKIHLLTSSLPTIGKSSGNTKSCEKQNGPNKRDGALIAINQRRWDLGQTYLSKKIPDYIKAEMEFGIIDKDCKLLIKRLERSLGLPDDGGNIPNELNNTTVQNSIKNIKLLRIAALRGMIEVDLGLGREARVERWRKTISDIQG